jgi:FtsZ-interacting cell division protein ZipA
MTNSRLAILILIVMAIAMAGIMVETYWDCRLLKGGSFKECVPPHPAPIGLH